MLVARSLAVNISCGSHYLFFAKSVLLVRQAIVLLKIPRMRCQDLLLEVEGARAPVPHIAGDSDDIS